MHPKTAAAAIALLAFGCNDSSDGDSSGAASSHPVDDTASADCTTALAQALTWDSWAHGFFLDNCTSCHNSTLPKEDRQKAPLAFNYDTYEGVVKNASDIKYRAVTAEPKYLMPPYIDLGETERQTLGLWIDCGLKEH